MALSKKAVGACLAFLWLPFFWGNAASKRQGQSETIYPRGVEACRVCHQAIFDAFTQTAHFKTSARASASSITGAGKRNFADGRNILRTHTAGVLFIMERRGADFYQTAVDAPGNRTRTERFDIVIGSGRKGQSYLYWKDRLLFQ